MQHKLSWLVVALMMGLFTHFPAHAEIGPRSSTTFSCSDTRSTIEGKGAASATLDGITVFAGYRQVSGNNQNPIVVGFDGFDRIWCRDNYDTSGADSRAYGVVAANGFLYATFTADGGNVDLRDFTSNGWLNSYGMGGGPSVSVVLRINPATGNPTGGTFIIAKLTNGNTNSANVTDIQAFGDNIAIIGSSAFGPLTVNRQRNFDCTANEWTYILPPDLGNALVTHCPGSSTGNGGAAGDCNLDSAIDAGDLAAHLLPLVSGNGLVTTGCDADGSGAVSTSDVACTRAKLFDPSASCAP